MSLRAASVLVVGVGLLCASAAVAVTKNLGIPLLRDAALPIRHVELLGDLQHLDGARARLLLGPLLGTNLIAVDMSTLRAGLESHPWVERAVVVRVWPDRLRIHLQERDPVARWGRDQFIDANAHRFDADGESRPELPSVHGPEGLERSLIIALGLSSERLSGLGLGLDSLTLDDRRAWTIRLDNGVELRLGTLQFARRLQRFVDAYNPFLAARIDRIATVDLRYTNGFALSWRPGAGEASEPIDGGSVIDAEKG